MTHAMRSTFLLFPICLSAFFSAFVAVPALRAQTEWPAYGGDLSNTRYSALDQINIQNVTKLTPAWMYMGKNGKQYVVVDAGDALLAYALP